MQHRSRSGLDQEPLVQLVRRKVPNDVWFHGTNRKERTRQGRGSCSRFRRVPASPPLQRLKYDSAKECQCLLSIFIITCSEGERGEGLGGNLETIWDCTAKFPFPLTIVILTIDLCSAWMAFPSVLGCQCGSLTELFNSVRQRRFRPPLVGKSTYTITVGSAFTTLHKHWLFFQTVLLVLCRWISKIYSSCCCCH